MSRLEEVKKYEGRLREIAEQISDIAEELGMSVHIDSTYSYGGVSVIANLFDNSDTWYDCQNIVTKNMGLENDAIWEANKRGEWQ